MGLTVETPPPPELREIDPNEYDDADLASEADYRREEIEAFLRDGAWDRAFEEWAAHTDMDGTEFAIVTDLDSWGTVSAINAGLTELGQVVCEVLKAEYIDWETDYEAPDDLPDF